MRTVQAVRLLQAAVPISAAFTAPFYTRPDPGEDDFFRSSVHLLIARRTLFVHYAVHSMPMGNVLTGEGDQPFGRCAVRETPPAAGMLLASRGAIMATQLYSIDQFDFNPQRKLHPSPLDWRDQFIYFLLIDRFQKAGDGSPPLRRGETP